VRTAPPPVVFFPETNTVKVLSSDGVHYYNVTKDGTCDCAAGQHRHGCRHVPIARQHLQTLLAAAPTDAFDRLDRAREEEARRPRHLTPEDQRRLDLLLSEVEG
jgi:hypothetical protein